MQTNIEDHIKGEFKVIGLVRFSVYFYSKEISESYPPIPIVTGLHCDGIAAKIANKLNDVLEDLKQEYE